MAAQSQQGPPGYGETMPNPTPTSPHAGHSQFASASGYGLPGVTVAPPVQPTPILPPINPHQTATGNLPRSNTAPAMGEIPVASGPIPVASQPVQAAGMMYADQNPKAANKELRKRQLENGCAICLEMTCVTLAVTWAATIAACDLAICCMECAS